MSLNKFCCRCCVLICLFIRHVHAQNKYTLENYLVIKQFTVKLQASISEMEAEPKKVVLQGKDGNDVEITVGTTPEYEFKPGEVVHFCKSLRNGKVALIRGVSEGLLWFSVFPTAEEALRPEALKAPVETASCRVKAEFIRQYGWMIDEKVNIHAQ